MKQNEFDIWPFYIMLLYGFALIIYGIWIRDPSEGFIISGLSLIILTDLMIVITYRKEKK